jgi:integral membrane protein
MREHPYMSDIEVSAPSTDAERTPRSPKPRNLAGALLRYRVLAYTVGTGLVILVCVGVPLQVWGHSDGVAAVVGILHGWLFIVYLLLTFDLARRAGWRLTRVVLVGLAGTIPFLSFYAERKVTGWVRANQRADAELAAAQG